MALDTGFSEAFIHRLASPYRAENPWSAHRVCGRRLRPLSLWHILLLQYVQSPLLTNPAAIGGGDILRAVDICRCRFREVNVRGRWTVRALWRLAGKRVSRERAALLDYVADFLQRPECAPASAGRGRTVRIGLPPESVHVAATVIFASG